MERHKFEELVIEALNELPVEFQDMLDNIDVIVQEYPAREQLADIEDDMTLLGLYEGVPHTERTQGYSMALPDKITIFQKSVEAECYSEVEIIKEIKSVVCHEIAHHFGLDDKLLGKIEAEKTERRDS